MERLGSLDAHFTAGPRGPPQAKPTFTNCKSITEYLFFNKIPIGWDYFRMNESITEKGRVFKDDAERAMKDI